MRKKHKKIIEIIKIYCIIGIIITMSILIYINNVILSDKNSIKVSSKISGNKQVNLLVDVPNDAKDINETYDGNYIVYLEKGKVNIIDAKKNIKLKIVEEKYEVIYAEPLSDRNIVIFFVYYNGQLFVKTYDINNDEMTTHNNFSVNNFKSVRDVRYSSLTNLIYINVEKKNGNSNTNYIYKIDIMKHVNTFASNKLIRNMVLLNNSDILVYEDDKNNVYINNKIYSYKNNNKLKLIGSDSDDNIYLSEKDNPSTILVLKDNIIINTINIDDSNYKSIYNKNNNVYLIYNSFIYNIKDNQKINIEKEMRFLDIKGDKILIYDANNDKILIKSIYSKN